MTRVLAVVAHPDDEVLGPGGTLRTHVLRGDEVHVLIVAEGTTSRDGAERHPVTAEETEKACATLGVAGYVRFDLADNRLDTYPLLRLAKRVGQVVGDIGPAVVYTHHTGDLNVDHELTARACAIACRPHASPVAWLLGFATLSATDAGFAARPPFTPAVYAPITATLDTKLAAMSCYASELRDFPHPRSLTAIRAQAELFGAHVGVPAAEAFSLVRGTWLPGMVADHTDGKV